MGEDNRTRPRVGIVGAGQLARMTVPPALALGVDLRLLAVRGDDSAAQVCCDVVLGAPTDVAALEQLAAGCDAITFDHELVDAGALAAAGHTVRPDAGALRFAQDKAHQRRAFTAAGLPVPEHAEVPDALAVSAFAEAAGWPVVLKAPTGGYDGRGVWMAADTEQAAAVFAEAGGGPLLVEQRVPIQRELAVLIVRRPGGDSVVYPVVETVQTDGICTELAVPAAVPAEVADEAAALAVRVADVVGAVGVMALELFFDGRELLVNEVATRPHNSGHWTIEGSVTSQFANHLRAVLDWPLGQTTMTAGAVATVNLLGPADGSDPSSRVPAALEIPGVAVHLYGKAARPGRKLGHVTACGAEAEETRSRAHQAARILTGGQ